MQDYDGIEQDPFIPHQCNHWPSPNRRCGCYAMHNEYFCYKHRMNPSPTIVPSDEFSLSRPHDRDSIQAALADIAVRLAAKTIDDRRAGLILYSLQIATCNLDAQERKRPKAKPANEMPAANETAVAYQTAVTTETAVILSEAKNPRIPSAVPLDPVPQPAPTSLQPPTDNLQPELCPPLHPRPLPQQPRTLNLEPRTSSPLH
jgi:hypothetical protein